MTAAQTIQIRLSECRQTLNSLLQVETRSAEQQTELETLTAEVSKREPELRAALAAEPNPNEVLVKGDAETRELALLTETANLGSILSATFEKRQTDGAAAELQKHHGIGSHQIPLEMLRIDRGVETRAAATVPAGIADASQGEVITPVFASGDGAFMGIERPTVPVGDAAFPVLSTMPAVKGPFTDSTEAVQTDAEFVATNLSPARLQASFSYRRTDAARFAGLDAALRLALNGGLQEQLDQQAIEGTDGLLTGTNLPNNNVNAISTFALYLSGLLYGRVVPTRDADGSLRIETRATPAILTAYKTRRYFSVEFHALAEVRTAGGVREITRALVDAAAMVSSPEYSQATAEVRSTQRRVWL